MNDILQAKANTRDLILAYIIGMQSELKNNTEDPQYQILQNLMDTIEERHGGMCQPYND